MKINRSELFIMAWRIARTTASRENCKASECLAYGLSEAWKIFKASASGRPVIHSVTRSLPTGSMHVSRFNVITGCYETTIFKLGYSEITVRDDESPRHHKITDFGISPFL